MATRGTQSVGTRSSTRLQTAAGVNGSASKRKSTPASKAKPPAKKAKKSAPQKKVVKAKAPAKSSVRVPDDEGNDDSDSEISFDETEVAQEHGQVQEPSVTQQLLARIEELEQAAAQASVVTAAEQTAFAVAGNIMGDGESTSQKLNSPSLPPDIHLKPEMIAKIGGNKFVNFGKLLYKNDRDDKKFTLKLNSTNNFGAITVDKDEHSVRIKNIDAWDRAFTVFQYTYVKMHPEDALGLIKYGRDIKDMAWRGFNWLQYDENFRRLREYDTASNPWGKINADLWAVWAIPRAITMNAGISQTIGRSFAQSSTSRNNNNFAGASANDNFGGRGQFGNSSSMGNQGGNGGFNRSNQGGQFGNGSSSMGNQGGNRGLNKSDKPCFRFNGRFGERFCSKPPCQYKHVCEICGRDGHGAATCRQ